MKNRNTGVDLRAAQTKTAVITGAASGMGLCASKTLAKAGWNVVMCDIDAKALKKAGTECRPHAGADLRAAKSPVDAALRAAQIIPCVTDVRRFADAEKAARLAVRKTGRIDLYIGFAGGYEARICNTCGIPFYEQPIEVVDWGLDVNLKGQVYFARAVMPQMVKQKSGVICCLGSVTGVEGDGNGAMYGTAKSGLFNFVKGLAIAGAPHNVRAFCVTPGPVMTRPGMAGMKTLQGHASQPQELVDFILYLASDKCPSITGSNHVMDCGRLALPRQ